MSRIFIQTQHCARSHANDIVRSEILAKFAFCVYGRHVFAIVRKRYRGKYHGIQLGCILSNEVSLARIKYFEANTHMSPLSPLEWTAPRHSPECVFVTRSVVVPPESRFASEILVLRTPALSRQW